MELVCITESAQYKRRLLHKGESLCCFWDSASVTYGDCCIKANRCVDFGLRLRSHTEVCSLQTSPSAPCASSFLQSQDNLACKIVRLLTFATVTYGGMLPSDLTLSALRFILSAKSGQSCKQDCETVDFCNSLMIKVSSFQLLPRKWPNSSDLFPT